LRLALGEIGEFPFVAPILKLEDDERSALWLPFG